MRRHYLRGLQSRLINDIVQRRSLVGEEGFLSDHFVRSDHVGMVPKEVEGWSNDIGGRSGRHHGVGDGIDKVLI